MLELLGDKVGTTINAHLVVQIPHNSAYEPVNVHSIIENYLDKSIYKFLKQKNKSPESGIYHTARRGYSCIPETYQKCKIKQPMLEETVDSRCEEALPHQDHKPRTYQHASNLLR